MLTYLTEILSKEKWEKTPKYGKKIWGKIDLRAYKNSLRYIKSKIFTPANMSDKRFIFIQTNGSKITNANVFSYDLDENDNKLIELINKTGVYTIPNNRHKSFLSLGKVMRGKEILGINSAITSQEMRNMFQNLPADEEALEKGLKARLDKLEQLKKDPEKNAQAIKGIENRIEQERKGMTYESMQKIFDTYTDKLENILKTKYVIVLTYDTRAVASMSTGNSWKSCMNLDNGEFNHHVPSSISVGAFVAYLATRKDKTTLSNPIARVLCKAYYSNDVNGENPDVIWGKSRFYGSNNSNARDWFPDIVSEFLRANNKPKYSIYKLSPAQYNDGDEMFLRFDVEKDGVTETSTHHIKFPNVRADAGHDEVLEIIEDELSDRERRSLIRETLQDEAIREMMAEHASDNIDENELEDEIEYEFKNDTHAMSDLALEFLLTLTNNSLYEIAKSSYDFKKLYDLLMDFKEVENFDIKTLELFPPKEGEKFLPVHDLWVKAEKLISQFDNISLKKFDKIFEKAIRLYKQLGEEEIDDMTEYVRLNKKHFTNMRERAIDKQVEDWIEDLYDLRQNNVPDEVWNAFVEDLVNTYNDRGYGD